MTSVCEPVRRTIERHALCPPGTRLLVALSGGSDSVALFRLMKDLADAGRLEIAGVAHFNHQLRPGALRDEAFCRDLVERAGCSFLAGTADVRTRARERGHSLEDAARRERYAFLHDAASRVHATGIATGHTKDDQTETFLLKLARGAGLTGLGGIYPWRGLVIRPLLEVTRLELRGYLETLGQPWMEDETNTDITNPRNRVRHILLPQLDATFGPSVRDAIARAAMLAGDDAAWLDAMAAEKMEELTVTGLDGIELDSGRLRALPVPLLRRVLRLVLCRHADDKEIGLRHIDGAMDLLAGRCGSMDVPGGRWELLGGKLVLLKQGQAEGTGKANPFSYQLGIPGQVLVPEADCLVAAEPLSSVAGSQYVREHPGSSEVALISQAGLDQLVVRSRRPGDRLRLPGLHGRKKLQDLFVDAKVPRAMRDRTPVVVDPDDRIVWVPGHAISADFRLSGGEDAVILLKFTRVGGKA